jgi:hypothetical protein
VEAIIIIDGCWFTTNLKKPSHHPKMAAAA